MKNFLQYQYVVFVLALKPPMTALELADYLVGKLNFPTTGKTPERTISAYLSQNMKGKQCNRKGESNHVHRGNWFKILPDGNYTLNCDSHNSLQARCNFARQAYYESNPSKKVFSDDDINELATLCLQNDPQLNQQQVLEALHAELKPIPREEKKQTLSDKREAIPDSEKSNLYTEQDFLREVYLPRQVLQTLKNLLLHKKNIILQGAPGVGKTFIAKRLAYSIIGKIDDSRVAFVQFHQNYSYEDFVIGYKPEACGFQLKEGIFYQFCNTAAAHPDQKYFFVIDEINRGNMSKIFGELLMLIEKDYRGTSLTLAYNSKPFCVPPNLYIIGMMNTADRSLAMIDYALRRRFSFFDIAPGFDSEGFKKYQQSLNSPKLDRLVGELKNLNQAISEDKSLGKGFCIGHSYLCGETVCSDEWLKDVVEYDILPMLAEYWFDDQECYDGWAKRLRDAVK